MINLNDAYTLSSWVVSLLGFLESRGFSRDNLLQQAGLDPTLLQNTHARYPVQGISRLWQYAYEQAGATVGLEVAKYFRPGHWSTLGVSLQSSLNVDEFLQRICRYVSLISDAVEVRYESSSVAAKKIVTSFLLPVNLQDERMEFYMLAALRLSEMVFGAPARLARVDLTRQLPDNPQPWHEAFGKNIFWRAPEFAIHFEQKVLAVKTPFVDSRLSSLHETELSARLAQQNRESFSQQIRREVLHMLAHGEPAIKDVAAHMNMSVRSVQRHLEEEGLSFRGVVDSIRLHVAQQYLSQTRRSLTEIAMLTGFSNQSNFSNAFKRWTQMTPNRYREQQADKLKTE